MLSTESNLYTATVSVAQQLPVIWTIILLNVRYAGLLAFMPGIGMGMQGLLVRYPAIFILSVATLMNSKKAEIPSDLVLLALQVVSEFSVGIILGLIPAFVVYGAQVAGHFTGLSMGLSAGNLFDPSFGTSNSDMGRLYSDFTILVFLALGGHQIMILAASGLGGEFQPGGLAAINGDTVTFIIDRAAHIFNMGLMMASPVIVALLLTQFVLGMISKAVPSVNVFIVSFPLTIGIGLIITLLGLPEAIRFINKEFVGIEALSLNLLTSMK